MHLSQSRLYQFLILIFSISLGNAKNALHVDESIHTQSSHVSKCGRHSCACAESIPPFLWLGSDFFRVHPPPPGLGFVSCDWYEVPTPFDNEAGQLTFHIGSWCHLRALCMWRNEPLYCLNFFESVFPLLAAQSLPVDPAQEE